MELKNLAVRRFPEIVQQMENSQDRVAFQHARSGIAHHLAHFFAHVGFIAVDRAVGAGGFLLSKWTMVQADHRIGVQRFALRTQL